MSYIVKDVARELLFVRCDTPDENEQDIDVGKVGYILSFYMLFARKSKQVSFINDTPCFRIDADQIIIKDDVILALNPLGLKGWYCLNEDVSDSFTSSVGEKISREI